MKMQKVTDDAPSNDDLIIIFMFICSSPSRQKYEEKKLKGKQQKRKVS